MRKPSVAAQVGVALLGAVLGLLLGAVLGAVIYDLVMPRHACGNIGCWDFVEGGFIGAGLGFFAGPVLSVLGLRRVQRA